MPREEAEKKVLENKATMKEPDNLNWFLDSLEITRSEMDQVLADPFRHMKFIKQENLLRRSFRTVKHHVLDPILGRG